jgi:hypothetical protein
MSTTVVISQIVQRSDIGATQVKGTVGGTTHYYQRQNLPLAIGAATTLNLSPAQFATEYGNHYNAQAAATAVLASQTYAYLPQPGGAQVIIVFGATPTVELSYDELEITATVNSVSTKVQVSQRNYLEYFAAGSNPNPAVNLFTWLADLFWQQYNLNLQAGRTNAVYIATFTLTLTTWTSNPDTFGAKKLHLMPTIAEVRDAGYSPEAAARIVAEQQEGSEIPPIQEPFTPAAPLPAEVTARKATEKPQEVNQRAQNADDLAFASYQSMQHKGPK